MDKTKKNYNDEIRLLRKRIVILEKLNAHYKKMEEKFNETLTYAENIVETVREPLLIMDGNLKIVSANKAFYNTFKVSPKGTQGRFIYDLGNGQWNIPELRRLLKEIITKKNTLDDYEIEHKFQTIGQKTMLLNARRIPPTPARPRIILLAIEDITEKKKMQEEITTGLRERVKSRTKQLDIANQKLRDKISELEIFNKAAVGRELEMIELKKEIEGLRRRK